MLSYISDVKKLFKPNDFACMNAHHWPLGSADFMCDPAGNADYPDHAHARQTYARLTSEDPDLRMPRGGAPWSAAKISIFRQWMDDGFAS